MKFRHLLSTIALAIPVLSFSQTPEELVAEGKKLKDDKKSAQAISKFQQAVNMQPNYTEARYELAWCQNDTKKYNDAISNLRIVRQDWSNYRSEEHTSELQSLRHLVCRLLLEKKKNSLYSL